MKYYILRADGSSIFEQPYSEDFIFHCLINLLDRSEEQFYLSWMHAGCNFAAVQADSADTAVECISLCEPVEHKSILTYILM